MKIKLTLSIIVLLFFVSTLSSQKTEKSDSIINSQVDINPQPVDNFIRTGMITPNLSIAGYAMLAYQYTESEKLHDVRPRFVFISMNGKVGEHFRYFLLADFAHPHLFEYYGEWTFSKYVGVRLGQQKVPFTYENLISPTNLESVYSSRTASSLAGMNDDVSVTTSGRDIGIQSFGALFNDFLKYNVGFFQGTGINTKENNSRKDFTATLSIQPVKGARLGGGLYLGEAVYAVEQGVEATSNIRNRWALSADYESDRFYTRAEWINGQDADTYKSGIYATALWYFIPKKLNGFVRLDRFNSDTAVNSTATDLVVGGSFYFSPRCRLMINYVHSEFSDSWTGGRNKNSVFAQMQVVF